MTRRSVTRHRQAVGAFMQTTACEIIDGARATLTDTSVDDTVTIHEVRKAMKRWRALLRLVAFAIGEDSKRLRTEARDLARTLRHSRDAQSAIDALDDILKHQPQDEPLRGAATIRERLLALRNESEGQQLGATDRAGMVASLDAAANAIGEWPITNVKFDDLADELTKTYRRGRRLIPQDWQSADPEHLHELRQRTVELRHQLECLAPLLPGLPRGSIAETQRLRNQLGRHQDLTLLWPLIKPGQPLARWRPQLTPLVKARQAEHTAAAGRTAARVYDRTSKDFRKRLMSLWKAAPEVATD